MNLLKRIALREITKKAVELHRGGMSIETITRRFWADPKVTAGLVALDITDAELTKIIKEKVNKKEDQIK